MNPRRKRRKERRWHKRRERAGWRSSTDAWGEGPFTPADDIRRWGKSLFSRAPIHAVTVSKEFVDSL